MSLRSIRKPFFANVFAPNTMAAMSAHGMEWASIAQAVAAAVALAAPVSRHRQHKAPVGEALQPSLADSATAATPGRPAGNQLPLSPPTDGPARTLVYGPGPVRSFRAHLLDSSRRGALSENGSTGRTRPRMWSNYP